MLPSNIHKNDGFGDFYPLGFSPTGISIAADFNNDGRIDIFSSNNISNKIWLNNPLAFTVDDIVPSDYSINVSTARSIYVTFNDFPDPTSFNPTSFTLINSNNVQVSGYFEFNDFQVSFTPFEPLESNMEYTITLTYELKSLAGISLTTSTTSTFTTETVQIPVIGTLSSPTICAGETAYFEIAPTNATPYGSVSFQWQVDEGLGAGFVDIFNNEIYKITPDFQEGIPASSLEIQNASHLLNGFQFQCIVSNEAGSETTDPATLTVLGQKADAGDDVSVFTTIIPIQAVTAQLNAETLISEVTGVWTCSNINVTLTNSTANITTANNISEGATIFYWTVTGGGCESSDQVIVYSGASIITTGTLTNWNDPASWFPPAIPGPNDSITVFNTNLDLRGINAVCGELYIGSGSNVIVADNGKGNGISTPVSSTSSLPEFQRGWNYIGNPYPCTVNFNLLTLTDIHPVKYTYNQSTNNFDVYMQNGVSTNGAGPYLGLGECFITKAFENVATANFDFKESARLHFFDALKSSEPKSGILELKITNALGTQNDFASVAFNPAATGNFDESFDAWELYPAYMSSMSLYTLSTDSKQLAINTIPEPSSSITEVTMGFKKVNIGNYTISVTQNTLNTAVGVSLRDNGTNPVTLIDLRTTPTYTFNELSGSPEQRFTLIFDGSSSVSDISSDISIFGGKQSIQILSDKIMNAVSIEIIDISGRTVYSGFVNGNNQTIPVSAAEGIYLVKLTDNEQIKTTKVYITK